LRERLQAHGWLAGQVGYCRPEYPAEYATTLCGLTPVCGSDGAPVALSPSPCGGLEPRQQLGPTGSVASCDGRYRLAHQTDGNVVLYEAASGRVLWSSGTARRATSRLVMQGDGNLVLYDLGSRPLWASGTAAQPGARLAVQGDGNVVIYASDWRALWSTGTSQAAPSPPPPPSSSPPPPPPSPCGVLGSGHALEAGQHVLSCDGRFELVYQGDGNLVLYRHPGPVPLWASGTDGYGAGRLVMQGDGNLVVYDPAWAPLWASGTDGNAGAWLAVQTDGNVVVYASDARPLWASGTNER
jgi:hypothetical protein